MNLGTFGFTVNNEPDGSHLSTARELEQLGFDTLWIVGGQLDRLDRLTDLLDSTERATVASAIISPEVFDSETVASLTSAPTGNARPTPRRIGFTASARCTISTE